MAGDERNCKNRLLARLSWKHGNKQEEVSDHMIFIVANLLFQEHSAIVLTGGPDQRPASRYRESGGNDPSTTTLRRSLQTMFSIVKPARKHHRRSSRQAVLGYAPPMDWNMLESISWQKCRTRYTDCNGSLLPTIFTDMRAGGSAVGGSASVGVGANDNVSRQYKMTIDEACNILNVKKDIATSGAADDSALQELLNNYERMMKANEKTSHYVQSKIVRARERIEAELPM